MSAKTKNKMPDSNIEHQASPNSCSVLCFSLLSFCFLTAIANARIWPEQLSSIGFLLPYLEQTWQDANTPIVQSKDIRVNPIDFPTPYLEKTMLDANTHIVQTRNTETRSIPAKKPQTSDIDSVKLTTDLNQNLPKIDSALPANINTQHGRQLWRAGISAYRGKESNKSKEELKRLIELIRSIEFKPQKKSPEPVITIETVDTKVEPNETPFEVEVKEEPNKTTIESELTSEPITGQTLQMLLNKAQDPNQLDNPFELGEILYFSGYLREAAVFYQEALNRMGTVNDLTRRNRAWTLFQLANCLRESDQPAAKKIYVKLITEFPESMWVDLAKARVKVIDWLLKDQPQTLITKRQM
jgi:tetratricopeptide (TPR) repeat protein